MPFVKKEAIEFVLTKENGRLSVATHNEGDILLTVREGMMTAKIILTQAELLELKNTVLFDLWKLPPVEVETRLQPSVSNAFDEAFLRDDNETKQ